MDFVRLPFEEKNSYGTSDMASIRDRDPLFNFQLLPKHFFRDMIADFAGSDNRCEN